MAQVRTPWPIMSMPSIHSRSLGEREREMENWAVDSRSGSAGVLALRGLKRPSRTGRREAEHQGQSWVISVRGGR